MLDPDATSAEIAKAEADRASDGSEELSEMAVWPAYEHTVVSFIWASIARPRRP